MTSTGPALLGPLLRDVSRSFYLTLRVLPSAIRAQIGLAYLLARATDTIADTVVVPVEERLNALGRLRDCILGALGRELDLVRFARAEAAPGAATAAEHALLGRIGETLAVLATFPPGDQQLIRAVLNTIISGQALDLRRFTSVASVPNSPRKVIALQTDAELDDYTYRVAGCVGEFWTKICRAHLFPTAPLDYASLLTNGVRFGKGLQLVNILRDLPRDLREGRCYLPQEWLATHGLTPESLLDPANLPRFRPFYANYMQMAETYLADGWAYTNALPRAEARLRLACAWPVLIGMKTLSRLSAGNVLDPSQRIKISRGDVRQLMIWSVLCYPWPAAWNAMFNRSRP